MTRGGLSRLRDHWVAESCLLLVASLALLAAGVAWSGRPPAATGVGPILVTGADLQLSEAVGGAVGTNLLVPQLPKGGRATALAGVVLKAEDYGSVLVELEGTHPRDKLLFLWIAKEAPATILAAPLSWSGGDHVAARLNSELRWRGSVVAVGVGLAGPLPAPLTVRSLRIAPRSTATSLASAWREWTAFEGLDAQSSNFVIGGSDQSRPLFRVVPAAAVWAGLALALHLAFSVARRRPADPRVVATLFLAGWVALDARWQTDLWRQLGLTRERYAAKSSTEKRLAAEDGDLFRFAREIKRILPPRPQVVFLISPDPDRHDRYLQLRARYHLLPHNVCVYYWEPPREMVPGEYMLVFGSRPDLVYDDGAKTMRSGGRVVPVERILVDPLGALYRRL